MNKVETHKFRGTKYNIDLDGDWDGICDARNGSLSREILIQSGLSPKRKLTVLIHEALHACYGHLGEDQVEQGAEDIARFLWRIGYRV